MPTRKPRGGKLQQDAITVTDIYQNMMAMEARPLYGYPYQQPSDADLATLINQIEKALQGETMRKARGLMIRETMEIVIGRIGIMLAERDPNFNSMEFYAKAKGRPE